MRQRHPRAWSLQLALGDPADLAHQAANSYISNVADNIISVENTGVLETETRYSGDPWSDDFDKVIAQRYGSSSTLQDPLRIPVDAPTDAWRTSLPKTVFRYAEAGAVRQQQRAHRRIPACFVANPVRP